MVGKGTVSSLGASLGELAPAALLVAWRSSLSTASTFAPSSLARCVAALRSSCARSSRARSARTNASSSSSVERRTASPSSRWPASSCARARRAAVVAGAGRRPPPLAKRAHRRQLLLRRRRRRAALLIEPEAEPRRPSGARRRRQHWSRACCGQSLWRLALRRSDVRSFGGERGGLRMSAKALDPASAATSLGPPTSTGESAWDACESRARSRRAIGRMPGERPCRRVSASQAPLRRRTASSRPRRRRIDRRRMPTPMRLLS